MAKNNVTRRLNLDISGLKRSVQEAKREMQIINKEFGASVAHLDRWSKAPEGVRSKLNQLTKTYEAQAKQLKITEELLRKEHEARKKNENALKEAQKNLKTVSGEYGKTSSEAQKYKDQIAVLNRSLTKNDQAIDKYGKDIEGLGIDMRKTSGESERWKGKLDELTNETKEYQKGVKDSGVETIKLSDIIKANLISDAIIGGVNALAGAIKNTLAGAMRTAWKVGAEGLETFSNLEETQNVVDKTFTKSADVVNKWSKDAAMAFGLSELSAKRFAGVAGSMLKSAGITSNKELTDMSTKIAELSADYASFYDSSPEEAFNKIKAGLSGSTQPLKEWGIDMQQVNLQQYALTQGITKQIKEMDQAELMMLRYNYLMHAGADAIGDFAANAGTYKNQIEIMKLQLENLSISLGSKLYPIATEIVSLFNQLLSGDIDVGQFAKKISEVVSNVSNEILKALPGLSEFIVKFIEGAVDSLIDSTKLISESVGSVVFEIAELLQKVLPDISKLFVELLKSVIGVVIKVLPGLLDTFSGIIVDSIKVLVGLVSDLLKTAVEITPDIIKALIEGLEGITEELIDILPDLISDFIEVALGVVLALLENADKLIEIASTIILGIAKGLKQSLPVIARMGVQIIDALVKAMATAWVKALDLIIELVSGWFKTVEEFKDYLVESGGDLFIGFITWLGELATAFWDWLSGLFPGLGKFFIELKDELVKAGTEILEGIKDKFNEITTAVINWGADMLYEGSIAIGDFVYGIIRKISQLPGDFAYWLKQTVRSVISWGANIYNTAIREMNDFVDIVWDIISDLPGMFWGIGRDAILGVWDGFRGSLDWVTNKITGAFDGMVGGVKGFLGIQSPSKLFAEIGDDTMAGYVQGIEKQKKSATRAVLDTFKAVTNVSDLLDNRPSLAVAGGPQLGGGGKQVNNYNIKQEYHYNKELNREEIYRGTESLIERQKRKNK